MASLTENLSARPGLLYRAVRALGELGESFSRARAASTEFDHLSNLSDAQLAARGLDRASIAQYIGKRHLNV